MRTHRSVHPCIVLICVIPVVIGLSGCPFNNNGDTYVEVPDVEGAMRSAAETSIRSEGLEVGTVTPEYSESVEEGRVLRQYPGGGMRVEEGELVHLWVSMGPRPTVTVPDVVGMLQTDAETAIAGAGLTVGAVTFEFDDAIPQGNVISQNPAGDTTAPEESGVDLMVSRGPGVLVPDVVNLDQPDAEAAIASAGLTASIILEYSDTIAEGSVILQSPAAGTRVEEGSSVQLAVSKGPRPEVTVPNVVGMTQAEAETAIVDAELVVGTITYEYSAEVEPGKVISQDPAGGATAYAEDAVDLVVSQAPPDLSVTPGSVSLNPAEPSETVTISKSGDGILNWSAASSDSRVTVSPASGSTLSSAGVTIAATDFSADYTATVTFVNDDDGGDTATVTVSVVSASSLLEISATSVSLSKATPTATVTVSNGGDGILNWSATRGDSRVTVSPASGITTESTNVTISASNFSEDFTTTVTFKNLADASDTKVVEVTVTGTSNLEVSHKIVRLSASAPSFTIGVSNGGGGTLQWSSTVEGGGLTVTPASGATTGTANVRISAGDYSAPYTATLTFTNTNNSSDTEEVTVSVGPDNLTIVLPDSVALEMRWIPAGKFMMGRYREEEDSDPNEDLRHEVTLSQGFWMGKYELTKAQWTAVTGTEPWSGRGYVLEDPHSPAVYVDWAGVQSFIRQLNNETGLAFRLPTEAEWEYACRAGTTWRFYWGDDDSTIGGYAWWKGNAYDAEENYAHIVGRKNRNSFGLFDMSGNVWEFCQDYYGTYPGDGAAVTDPTGPSTGSSRVVRGGGWGSEAWECRSARRLESSKLSTKKQYLGFRLAR